MLAMLGAFSSPAWAQSDEDRANARALADQGVQAFSEGRWQDTVDLFDRAEALIDAPTHLLYSARAHAKLHHYIKARELYLRITRQQLAPDAPKAFVKAQASAAQELKDVEPHIGQLTITVRGPDPKLAQVTLDGSAVHSALIGVARPIDPGEHQVHAQASGFSPQTKKITVEDAGKVSVTLELAAGAPTAVEAAAPGAGPPSKALPPSAGGVPATTKEAASASGPNTQRIAAYVAFGVGAVGLGVGTIFGLSSKNKRSQADDAFRQCGGATGCMNDDPLAEQVSSLDASARTQKTVSIVGFVAGGLGVGAGVALFVLSRRHDDAPASSWSITPRLGLGRAAITGTF